RVSASRPGSEPDAPAGNEITLHFVNYNREEPTDKRSRGSGIRDEKPVAAPPCQVDLKLPENAKVGRAVPARRGAPGETRPPTNNAGLSRVRRVEFLTPE